MKVLQQLARLQPIVEIRQHQMRQLSRMLQGIRQTVILLQVRQKQVLQSPSKIRQEQ